MAAEPFNTFVLATPVATVAAGADSVPIVQGGVTKHVTPPAVSLSGGDQVSSLANTGTVNVSFGATDPGTYLVAVKVIMTLVTTPDNVSLVLVNDLDGAQWDGPVNVAPGGGPGTVVVDSSNGTPITPSTNDSYFMIMPIKDANPQLTVTVGGSFVGTFDVYLTKFRIA